MTVMVMVAPVETLEAEALIVNVTPACAAIGKPITNIRVAVNRAKAEARMWTPSWLVRMPTRAGGVTRPYPGSISVSRTGVTEPEATQPPVAFNARRFVCPAMEVISLIMSEIFEVLSPRLIIASLVS